MPPVARRVCPVTSCYKKNCMRLRLTRKEVPTARRWTEKGYLSKIRNFIRRQLGTFARIFMNPKVILRGKRITVYKLVFWVTKIRRNIISTKRNLLLIGYISKVRFYRNQKTRHLGWLSFKIELLRITGTRNTLFTYIT